MKTLADAAEDAVRETIRDLVRSGKRAYSKNVPLEATKRLLSEQAGAITEEQATEAIQESIGAMTMNGELFASVELWQDWTLRGD